MGILLIKNRILVILVPLVLIFVLSCYNFEFINQPAIADPNSTFDVQISVSLQENHRDGIPHFGILLPIGWTVKDTIQYTGTLLGTLRYSKAISNTIENFSTAPNGYYWWVSVGDYVDSLMNGTVSFTPQIQTDNQSGTFFIQYILGDDYERPPSLIRYRTSNYPISVDVPMNITVTNTNDNGEGSLRQAILDVSNSGEIDFGLSYPDTIVLDSTLIVDRNVSIKGPENGNLTISGNNQNRVFYVNPNLTVSISYLIIANGRVFNDTSGGGLTIRDSNLYLQNVLFCNNFASGYGGGLYAYESDVVMMNATLVGNLCNRLGGAVYGGKLIIVNSILWGNTSYPIYAKEHLCIINSDIQYGSAGIRPGDCPQWLIDNINTDPMFIGASNGEYTLREGSPCINAGIQDTMIIYNDGQDSLFIPPMEFIGSAPDMGAYESPYTVVKIATDASLPIEFSLHQNHPNPFNPKTKISFTLPLPEHVTLAVYNTLGQKVATLLDRKMNAGAHDVNFNAKTLPSGIYFYRIQAGEFSQVKKMVSLR